MVLVRVHQVMRDFAGALLADEHVGHRFTIEQGLIRAMEVCPLSSPDLGAQQRPCPATIGFKWSTLRAYFRRSRLNAR